MFNFYIYFFLNHLTQKSSLTKVPVTWSEMPLTCAAPQRFKVCVAVCPSTSVFASLSPLLQHLFYGSDTAVFRQKALKTPGRTTSTADRCCHGPDGDHGLHVKFNKMRHGSPSRPDNDRHRRLKHEKKKKKTSVRMSYNWMENQTFNWCGDHQVIGFYSPLKKQTFFLELHLLKLWSRIHR